jgi:hypothetical protein
MANFDVSTAVADFYADESQNSLELPHMTTGQRKNTKKLLEQYPDIRCESYGFGADRRLHLFKKGHSDSESTAEAERFFANSAIHREADKAATSDEVRLNFASIAKLGHQRKLELEVDSDDKKCASLGTESRNSRAQNPELILPLTSEDLQIRNTFIHLSEASADERVIQSMPHGMFKQCLLSEAVEALKVAPFCNTPTSAGGDSPMFSEPDLDFDVIERSASPSLATGTLVKVEGLVKLPGYNGCSAVVQGWDETTGRYSILIASPGGLQQAKIKEENLTMLLPCP